MARECERVELELRTGTLLVYACELPAWAVSAATATVIPCVGGRGVEIGTFANNRVGVSDVALVPAQDGLRRAPEQNDVCSCDGVGDGERVRQASQAAAVSTAPSSSSACAPAPTKVQVCLSDSRQALRSLALHLKLAFDAYE